MTTIPTACVTIRLLPTKDEIVQAEGKTMNQAPIPRENENTDATNGVLQLNGSSDSMDKLPASKEKQHKREKSNDSDLEDFFKEVSQLAESEGEQQSDEELLKPPAEGEVELTWLKEAGFHRMVSQYEDGKELAADMVAVETATLTRKQTAAVKRRVDALNATLQRSSSQQRHGDVRELFGAASQEKSGAADKQEGPQSCLRSPKSNSKSKRKVVFSASDQQPSTDSTNAAVKSGGVVLRKESKRVSTIVRLPSRGGYYMQGAGQEENNGIEAISIHTKELDSPPPVESPNEKSPSTPDAELYFIESLAPRKDGLPNFVLDTNDLGVTHFNDLDGMDQTSIRRLCHLEVSAMFDSQGVTWMTRPSKKSKESGIFKVPLQTLFENDVKKHPKIKVPLFYKELLDHLNQCGVQEEGILRVPGSVTRIKHLRQEIEDKFYTGRFNWSDVTPNDAAALLKQLIRELPVPVLTHEYIDAFLHINSIVDSSRRQHLQALHLLVLILPPVHQEALMMLLAFLKRVVDHEGNKMTLNNVAMVIAPNLLGYSGASNVSGHVNPSQLIAMQQQEFQQAAQSSSVVRMLIKYQGIFHAIPPYILAQYRSKTDLEQTGQARKNREKNQESQFMWFLGEDQADHDVVQSLTEKTVIRVQAPRLSKGSTAVQLDAETTAKDIVSKFCTADFTIPKHTDKKKGKPNTNSSSAISPSAYEPGVFFTKTHLYEVGGNIGSRRLDHAAKMLATYKNNPAAQWVVKTDPQ